MDTLAETVGPTLAVVITVLTALFAVWKTSLKELLAIIKESMKRNSDNLEKCAENIEKSVQLHVTNSEALKKSCDAIENLSHDMRRLLDGRVCDCEEGPRNKTCT